jgi:cholesterol oxidase
VTYALEFTEKMTGWVALGARDYESGAQSGQRDGTGLMFRLTIATADVYRFIDDRDHLADARGYVHCELLGGRLRLERGWFNLFVADGPAHKQMLYRLFFFDAVGRPLTLVGYKDVRHGPVTAVWPETSTLYTTILDGHVEQTDVEPEPAPIAAGVLRIKPLDFAWQLTTFRVHGPAGGRTAALAAFGDLFANELWQVFRPATVRSGRE